MASTTIANRIFANCSAHFVEFDPDSGSETAVRLDPGASADFLAIGEFRRFACSVLHTVGTGGITTVTIYGATAADGTGAVAVASITPTTNDAVNDSSHLLECDVEQIREVLATATHVGVKIDLVTSTDELAVFFMRCEPMYPRTGLTVNYIS